ncbi:MAG: RNase adapter RapZ [Alphaproteobacteria bacterium]
MGDPRFAVRTLFLDCDDEVLMRRFTETRRRHPLAADRPLPDTIRLERRLLARLRDRADLVIDSTNKSQWELKAALSERFRLERDQGLSLFVTSFSFRQGLPREADLVFDVRFLANPHYDPVLRPLTGQDAPVDAAVAADPDFPAFFERLTGMLEVLLPRYRREGKSYLTIAIGCTGGRHRSVAVTERLARWLAAAGWDVHPHHRDIHRSAGRDMA